MNQNQKCVNNTLSNYRIKLEKSQELLDGNYPVQASKLLQRLDRDIEALQMAIRKNEVLK